MIGDLISAGVNLVGGLMGRQSAREANATNERMAAQNIALQKQFAQEGIRWKVDDAKAAGIHPLYALGANTTSFSPVSVGAVADSSMPNAMAAMGQNLGRAVNATRTSSERQQAFSDAAAKLELEGKSLDNDIKRASLASAVRTATQAANPPMPGVVPEASKYEDRPRLISGGVPLRTDPGSANAEDFEKRYGDIAQEIAGAANMYRDYLLTSGGMTPRQLLERGGRHPVDKFFYGDKPWLVPGGWADRVYRRYTGRHSSGW